jgi:ribA/ribD-fused uncharacterized protein
MPRKEVRAIEVAGKTVKRIAFYRATGPFGFLSNLYPRRVVFEGKEFACAETAYQFGKPKDRAVAEWLIAAPKPHLCAVAAHALLAFDIRKGWKDVKVDRMQAVIRAKFTQHEDLKKALLGTEDAILIEDSRTDTFWGTGSKKVGQNMLGRLLMEVREEMK